MTMSSSTTAYGLLRFVQEHAPARLDAIVTERAELVAQVIALDDEAAQLRRHLDFCTLPRPAGTLRPDLERDSEIPPAQHVPGSVIRIDRPGGYQAPLRRGEG